MDMQAQATLTLSSAQQAKPSFPGIVRSELAKITWLRSTWIMVAMVVVFTGALYFLNMGESRAILRSDPISYTYQFPLSQDLFIFRALTGYLAMVVTVFAIGLDYQYGTIRVILGRGVGRLQLLLGKIVALFIFALLIQIAGAIFNGILLGIAASTATGSLNVMGIILTHFAGIFTQYFLYMLFNMWISILLATALTVLGRSLTFGMAAALIWFPFDNIASTFFMLAHNLLPDNILPKLTAYLLGPNLNALTNLGISKRITPAGASPVVSVDAMHTIIVAIVYALIFLVVASVLTKRRDVKA